MSNNKPIKEGYRPEKKGYQPSSPNEQKPDGGYQPSTGQGADQTPKPPKSE